MARKEPPNLVNDGDVPEEDVQKTLRSLCNYPSDPTGCERLRYAAETIEHTKRELRWWKWYAMEAAKRLGERK